MEKYRQYEQSAGFPEPGFHGGSPFPGGPSGYHNMSQPIPYGSQQLNANSFCTPVSFVQASSSSFPPQYAIKKGHQTDGCGELWSAVANTPHGTIPGKAKDGTCWYPYGGREECTKDFNWITCLRPVEMKWNAGSVPPQAIQCGYQSDGCGYLYAAIAETKWGRIPGKAKDDTCWYPYGGKEHNTKDFHWLVMC